MKHDKKRVGSPALRFGCCLLLAGAALFTTSCTTTGGGSSSSGRLPAAALNHPQVQERNARIAQEAPGNYFIGRRWWTDGTRFWGYLRKPGEPWSESRLVIMNESLQKQPDRVPEEGVERVHGYDHNYEYKVWGSFTGNTVYDPNSNFRIPEFRLSRYELVSSNPGFLFWPGEKYSSRRLPPKHPPTF